LVEEGEVIGTFEMFWLKEVNEFDGRFWLDELANIDGKFLFDELVEIVEDI
jgi:hypothetical protein